MVDCIINELDQMCNFWQMHVLKMHVQISFSTKTKEETLFKRHMYTQLNIFPNPSQILLRHITLKYWHTMITACVAKGMQSSIIGSKNRSTNSAFEFN